MFDVINLEEGQLVSFNGANMRVKSTRYQDNTCQLSFLHKNHHIQVSVFEVNPPISFFIRYKSDIAILISLLSLFIGILK